MKMLKFVAVMLFVLVLCTPAIAGPECKSYTMYYEGDTYTLKFGCETTVIGGVFSMYNVDEYTQWWIYFFVEPENRVCIPKLASFELMDNNLYHIVYDYRLKKWFRTSAIFIGDDSNLEE